MQRTIELPDHLAQRLDTYLQEHPEETFYSLIQEVLETKLIPKDTSKLLALAGIVTEAPHNANEHAKDREI
ncbi:MAG: hypothetical protein HC764_14965 [Pleurocapsa sp. CRU_1_2]|nr:hypothetical protein [Pleurocapsa sp. CRU_1_2]